MKNTLKNYNKYIIMKNMLKNYKISGNKIKVYIEKNRNTIKVHCYTPEFTKENTKKVKTM